MFDMLIGSKKAVAVRCGTIDIVGVISNYYAPFRILKIGNLLLPVDLIEHIELLDDCLPPPFSRRSGRTSRKLRLVQS